MKVALAGGGRKRIAGGRDDELSAAGDAVQRRPHAGRMCAGDGRSGRDRRRRELRTGPAADAAAAARNARVRRMCPSPPSRPRSARPTSATRSRGCPSFPTTWKPSKFRDRHSPTSVELPEARASDTSAAAAAATRPTSAPSRRPRKHDPSISSSRCVIGIDVGGTKCAAGLVLFPEGSVLARRLQPTRPERGGAAVLADVVDLARSLQQEAAELDVSPAAIGLGVAELVSVDGQCSAKPRFDWKCRTSVKQLHAATELPVTSMPTSAPPPAAKLISAAAASFVRFFTSRSAPASARSLSSERSVCRRAGLNRHFASSRVDPERRRRTGVRPAAGAIRRRSGLGRAICRGTPEFHRHCPRVLALAEAGDSAAQADRRLRPARRRAPRLDNLSTAGPRSRGHRRRIWDLAEGCYRKSLVTRCGRTSGPTFIAIFPCGPPSWATMRVSSAPHWRP